MRCPDVTELEQGSEDNSVSRWTYNERRAGGSRFDLIRGNDGLGGRVEC